MAATDPTVELLDVAMPNEAAVDILKRVAAHLAAGQESGLLIALVTRSPNSSAMQVRPYNVCGSDVMAAVVMFLQQHVKSLASCHRPQDYLAEVTAIEDIVVRLKSLAGFDQVAMPGTAALH